MAFPKGGKNPNAGRVVGVKNKATEMRNQLHLETVMAIEESIKAGTLISPLDYLISVYQDENQPDSLRLQAAKAAMPFLHSAKPTSINQTISSPDSLFEINFIDKGQP